MLIVDDDDGCCCGDNCFRMACFKFIRFNPERFGRRKLGRREVVTNGVTDEVRGDVFTDGDVGCEEDDICIELRFGSD